MPKNQQSAISFADDKYYDVRVNRSVEFPPGSRNFLNPGDSIHLLGSAANSIKDAIAEAVEATEAKRSEIIGRG